MADSPTVARGWLQIAAAALALVVASYVFPFPETPAAILYAFVTVGLIAGAAGASFWRASKSEGSDRVAWMLLGWAAVAWGIGEVGWNFIYLVQDQVPSTPHWTDVPYLLNVPLTVAGVLALAWRPGTVGQTWARVVDALFVASALLLVAWLGFLKEPVAGSDARGLAAAVALAYPLGDVAILTAFALAFARLRRERLVQLWPLLAALALIAISDAGYAWVVLATGNYTESWFDLGWTAGAFGFLWAALRPGAPSRVGHGPAGRFEQWLPALVALLALMVLGNRLLRDREFDGPTTVMVLVVGPLILLRQGLLTGLHLDLLRRFRESQRVAGLAGWRWLSRQKRVDLGEYGAKVWGLPEARSAFQLAELAAPLHPADRQPFELAWSRLTSGTADLDLIVRIPDPTGERHLQMRGLRGRIPHGTVLDITTQARLEQERLRADLNRAEAERLAALARAKTQFINTAAHELSTPLTSIQLSLASIRTGPRGADEALARVERNVDRMARLLRDVLDGVRLQSDRLRLDLHPLDMAELARLSVEEHEASAREKGVLLAVKAPRSVTILGDSTRMHQVVMNLLHNAIKFTDRGGNIVVNVVGAEGRARLVVSDTGRGISPSDIDLLFQPFTQVGTLGFEGTGLGLYIVKGIVEQHGGIIRAESPGEGRGATFTVEIPLAVAPVAGAT